MIQAIGLLRLDDNEARTFAAIRLPEITGYAGSKSTDASLQKDVRDSAFFCMTSGSLDDLGGDRAITLHDVARNGFIAIVRGV